MPSSAEIRDREASICARCGHAGDEAHHRLTRARGGPDSWSNLIWLCRQCHRWAHVKDPVQAEADGLLLPSGADPRTVPTRYHLLGGALVLLADDGTISLKGGDSG
jgi:hypothetical protein